MKPFPVRLYPYALFTFLIVAAAGCATASAPSIPDVAGDYEGGVMVEGEMMDGQEIRGRLTIDQALGRLTVIFRAPEFGLVARGSGRVEVDGTARLNLDYDLECPGEARFIGQFTEDATVFQGELTAEDCTGELAGTFSFSR